MPHDYRKLIALLGLAVLLVACSPPDPGEIIPTRTPLPPPTDTPIPPTATPTTTPVPTLTPTPGPRPSPTPEVSLSTRGPWLVFSAMPDPARSGRFGLFAANADGTGLTHLSDDVVQAFAGQDAASPVAARVAYTALTDDGGLVLRQVRLPNGPAITAASLVPPGYEPPASRAEDETRWQAYEVSRSQPPRWAPDGDHIAYVGFAEGPDADVYLYNLFTGVSVRLSDEPGHAIEPQWAPDGRFIVYGVRHDPNAGSTVLVDEVWVAWTNGTGDKPLYTPSGAGERLFGWLEYDTVLVASSAQGCAYERLRAVEVESGAEFMLWPGHFRQAAFDPATGAVLLEAGAFSADCAGGEGAPREGLYFIPPGGEPRAVPGGSAPARRPGTDSALGGDTAGVCCDVWPLRRAAQRRADGHAVRRGRRAAAPAGCALRRRAGWRVDGVVRRRLDRADRAVGRAEGGPAAAGLQRGGADGHLGARQPHVVLLPPARQPGAGHLRGAQPWLQARPAGRRPAHCAGACVGAPPALACCIDKADPVW